MFDFIVRPFDKFTCNSCVRASVLPYCFYKKVIVLIKNDMPYTSDNKRGRGRNKRELVSTIQTQYGMKF